ncbi:glycosyltransferase [Candidatus Microgenomates bacterium]|nr:glycosyltransferase [Candidatus Microgenomates bacterium]
MTNTNTKKTKCSKILFASFSPWENGQRSPTNGLIEPMLDFFSPKIKRFVLIDQPHPGSDRLIPRVETYKRGKLKDIKKSSILVSFLYPILYLRNTLKTSLIFKIRDFLSVLDYGLLKREHFDLFIGLESVNTIAGVILKRFGLVDSVVYYVSDFSLKRYVNPLLNKIYLLLDRIAFNNADFVWDISPALMQARIKAGLDLKSVKTSIHVPIALFSEQLTSLPSKQTIPFSIAYAGLVSSENGPSIALKALKKVLRTFPKAQLHIFAMGRDIDIQKLRDLTNKLVIQKKVFIHGFISNQTDLIKDLSQYRIGLAPYLTKEGSHRWWADATRIRLYLAAGLPVITTPVPPAGNELTKNNSGFVVKDNETKFAKTIGLLFKNNNLYNKMKKNAIKQAKDNTWDKVYTKTLKKMNVSLVK